MLPLIGQRLDADHVCVEPDSAELGQQRVPGQVTGVGHGPEAGLHQTRGPERGQRRAREQGGEGEVQHLGTHGHYMSHGTHDACLNVGVETGQGLQSAGHRDHGGGEAHDHFMARVMSALIWRISIEVFISIYMLPGNTLQSTKLQRFEEDLLISAGVNNPYRVILHSCRRH